MLLFHGTCVTGPREEHSRAGHGKRVNMMLPLTSAGSLASIHKRSEVVADAQG